jgi:hypothetical protein
MPFDGQAIAALFGSSSIVCFYGENRMERQGKRGELEAPTRDQGKRWKKKETKNKCNVTDKWIKKLGSLI